MGMHAPEGAHPLFSKRKLSEEGKKMFAAHDEIASNVMIAFDHLPPSREASLAKTKLEEAIFWANRSIVMCPDYCE